MLTEATGVRAAEAAIGSRPEVLSRLRKAAAGNIPCARTESCALPALALAGMIRADLIDGPQGSMLRRLMPAVAPTLLPGVGRTRTGSCDLDWRRLVRPLRQTGLLRLVATGHIGNVGIDERNAQSRGQHVKIGRLELRNDGKAKETGRHEGFIKVLIAANSGALVGATLLCADAAELIHFYVGVMNAKASAAVIANAICIHPTLAEALQSAITAARSPCPCRARPVALIGV